MDKPSHIERLDLVGERCPMTFVRARLRLEEMALGEVLELTVDFEPATRNIPKSAENWGQSCLSVDAVGESRWMIRILKQVE